MEDLGSSITVAELREIVLRVLDHLDRSTGGELTLDEDYFWSIPSEDLFEVFGEAPQLTIGQLSESIENLKEVRGNGGDGSAPIGYCLVWLADILKAIGSKHVA